MSNNFKVPKSHIWASLFGLGWGFPLQLVGTIYVSEFIAIFYVILNQTLSIKLERIGLVSIISIYLLILIGLMASDIFNGTESKDALRAWSSVFVGGFSLIFVTKILSHDARASIPLFASLAIGKLLIIEESDSVMSIENVNFFKAQIVPLLIPLLIAFTVWKSTLGSRIIMIYIFVIGVIFLVLGARSSGLILLAASVVTLMMTVSKRRMIRSFIFIVPLVLFAAYMGYVFYVNLILSLADGSNSYVQLSRTKNPYNPFELLYQGRLDAFVAIQAIIQKPIMGYGSWANDTSGTFSLLAAQLSGSNVVATSDLIRGHSFILTAWLWGGIIGLLGAVLLVSKVIFWFSCICRERSHVLYGATIILTVDFFWNFAFSPFGHIRTSFPMAIGMLIVLYRQTQNIRNS